jgi:HD-GYP domain-containing protein (c-di-GMP phosphodiesterase class II)
VAGACRPLVEAVGKNKFKGILAAVQHDDNYTNVHSLRVAALLTLFGQAAGLRKGIR